MFYRQACFAARAFAILFGVYGWIEAYQRRGSISNNMLDIIVFLLSAAFFGIAWGEIWSRLLTIKFQNQATEWCSQAWTKEKDEEKSEEISKAGLLFYDDAITHEDKSDRNLTAVVSCIALSVWFIPWV